MEIGRGPLGITLPDSPLLRAWLDSYVTLTLNCYKIEHYWKGITIERHNHEYSMIYDLEPWFILASEVGQSVDISKK